MARLRRKVQWSGASRRNCVQGRASAKEQTNDADMAGVCRVVQWRKAANGLCIHGRASSEKEAGDVKVATLCSTMERRDSTVLRDTWAGPS